MRTAILGLGKMGRLLAGHVLDAGHETTVWNRTAAAADDLVARGAHRAETPAAAAARADLVVTMLFDGPAVRSVLLDGPDPAAAGARGGTLVADVSSTGAEAARSIGAELASRGLRFVDVPVLGSTPLAEAGTLGVTAGGSDGDLAEVMPLLLTWADPAKVFRCGPVGAGQAMKSVVNAAMAAAGVALGEALGLADAYGLDEAMTMDALAGSALGWTLGQKRAALTSRSFAPPTFTTGAITKDLELLGGVSGVLAATRATAEQARAAGLGDEDYAAIIDRARRTPAP